MTTRPCGHCTRPVADSYLCRDCTDALHSLLMSVPGLVHDLELTRGRWDTVGRTRNGGKSADTALPIRLTGRVTPDAVMDARDTYKDPWTHRATDDRVPAAGPHRDLAEAVIYWGLQIELTSRVPIPVRAPGLSATVLLNRAPTARTASPAAVVTRLQRLQRGGPLIPVPQRAVSTPGADRLSTLPVTDHEAIAVWLAHNLAYVRRFEHAGAMFEAVDTAVQGARRAIDQPPELRYVGPCPDCRSDLYADTEATSSWVRCKRCRNQFDVEHVKGEGVKRAEGNLYTIARCSSVLEAIGLDIPRQTLHTWKRRGRIQVRGWLHKDPFTNLPSITTRQIDDRDPPVFRLGDVLRIARKWNDEEQTS